MKFHANLVLWRNFICEDERVLVYYFEYFLSLRLLLHGSFLTDLETIGEGTGEEPTVKGFTEVSNAGCGAGTAGVAGGTGILFFFETVFVYLNVAGLKNSVGPPTLAPKSLNILIRVVSSKAERGGDLEVEQRLFVAKDSWTI